MGTNFYWLADEAKKIIVDCEKELKELCDKAGVNFDLIKYKISTINRWDSTDPATHIGKRSAAGTYCWDCKITLCKGGKDGIHFGKSEWYDKCPKCNRAKGEIEIGWNNAAGVELGFSTQKDIIRRGVTSCSSFTFAQDSGLVQERLENGEYVVNEYGDIFTPEEFKKELEDCPIKFYSIGERFS